MTVSAATDQQQWDSFLGKQPFRPFLQSWTMGEIYREVGQEPIRLEIRAENELVGICFGHVVPAKRGKHLAIPYGPVIDETHDLRPVAEVLLEELKRIARGAGCYFIRLSPFWPLRTAPEIEGTISSPLHLLAEHLWYLPLADPDPWYMQSQRTNAQQNNRTKENDILMSMRKTTRNLIRRAEKEGVTVEASADPLRGLEIFIALHEETRKRHHFTPYTNAFFRAQVTHFAARNECTLYLARYQGEVIATSIHIHAFGETSYHHGASTHKYEKIPASYLLQWTAIRDALKRGDRIYNFWGVAPLGSLGEEESKTINQQRKTHPFTGVTTFKTGFGGKLLELVHCADIPLKKSYYLTRAFEVVRKWRRGF